MTKKHFALLATMIILIIALSPLAAASIPTVDTFTGQCAMAHWTTTANGDTITIDAVVAQEMLDSKGNPDTTKQNMVYISVSHSNLNSGAPSEVTTYNVPFSSWSMSSATLSGTFPFTLSGRTSSHPITITWTATTDPQTTNQFTDQNGNPVSAQGQWQSCTATITIDNNGGLHPTTITSSWAVIGLKTAPLFVAPEYPIAALGALASMIVAFACHRAIPIFRRKI